MKRRFTILTAAIALLTFLAVPLGMWGQTRTKITDYTQIVSGKTYYIGATLSNNTDYYFAAAHTYNSSTGIQGTSVTSQSDASVMTFVGSGTTWTIIFDNGKYLQLNSSNGGKVNILDANTTDIPTFTASTNNSLIRLTNSNTYLQRNSTAGTARFGSYSGTQTDIWLMEVSTALTVTYDANGATSGTVPTDAHEYNEGDPVTVLGNTGSLAKTGYTWSCWNTQADGTGTDRAAGSTFNISENTTLYAKWAPKTISGLSCTGTPTKTTYADGESFDPTGLTVTATYTDASSEDVTDVVTWTPDPLTTGTTSVTGTYMGMTVNVSGLTVTGAPEWVLTDISELTASDIFVIVGTNGGSYSMSNNNGTSNPPAATAVTIANGKITSTVSDNIKWNISGNATDGYTFYPNGSTTTYLFSNTSASSSSNDNVRVGNGGSYNRIVFELDNNNYLKTKDNYTTRYLSYYSGQWRAYTNTSNSPLTISFYKYQIPSSVATPTFSVAEGTYNENQSVTISCATDGATIYYTTDGSEPNLSSSTYSSALSITQNTTLKAKAYYNSEWSNMASATYTLKPVTPTFSPAAGTYVGAQNVTIASTTTGATIYYTLDGSTPTTESTQYTGTAINITETKTVKAIAIKSNWDNSEVATATYTIVVPLTTMQEIYDAAPTSGSQSYHITFNNWVVSGVRPGSSGSPSNKAYVTDGEKGFAIYKSGHGFAVGDRLSGTVECTLSRSAGAAQITNITSETAGLTVTSGGTVTVANIPIATLSGVNTGALVSYNNLYYDGTNLSDGTTDIKPYGDLMSISSLFESGKIYNVTGVYLQYNSTKEILPRTSADVVENTDPVLAVSPYTTNLTSSAASGTLAVTATNFSLGDATAPLTPCPIYNSNWDNILIPGEDPDYPSWLSLAYNYSDEQGTITYSVTANESTEPREAHFKLHLKIGEEDIHSDKIIITQAAGCTALPFIWAGGTSGELTAINGVSGNSLGDYAEGNAPYRVQFNASGDYILIKTNKQPAVVSVGIKKVGGSSNSSIIIQSSSNGSDFTNIETFSNPGAQNATMTHVTTNDFNANDRYVRIYFNKPSGGSNVGVGPITIKGIETYTLTVNGYTTNANGWNLIASPVATTPTAVTNMLTEETAEPYSYDLYRYNASAANGKVWENYHQHSSGFNIVPGQGYLYANSNTVELSFTGKPYVGNGEISMPQAGYNLIGNPYSTNATVDADDFYIMNEAGSQIIPADNDHKTISPMQGLFVEAAAANETVTFTEVTPAGSAGSNNNSSVVMNLSQNRGGVIDRAIVRFGEGRTLSKFEFFENNTKLYIAQDGKDYAVARSEAQGEMPVNFRANENGQYTLTVNAENVEMNYLHLIDNMTGADIDLLQTPSYTFNANVMDYESRFRLVFAANNEDGSSTSSETFSFYSNGNWVVNNEGNATLQVIDALGRILSNESISGTVSKSINAPAGVYVLRLINGENVKTQKIVVR